MSISNRSWEPRCVMAAALLCALSACRMGSVSSVQAGTASVPTSVPVAVEGGTAIGSGAPARVSVDMEPAPAPGASYIPLTLSAAPVATSIPVKTGVPFPAGALKNLGNMRLESADGTQEIAAQIDTLASWPDGSIKSALVQFVTDVGATKSYRVAYGSTVVRANVPAGVSASTAGVDTGALKIAFNNKGLISALWRDTNHNGLYEAGEQVLGGGEFFMVNAADGIEYTASQAAAADIVVEENGPVRAVVRARGSLANANGAVLIKYQVRYYAWANSDKLDIEYTVIDDRAEANVESPGTRLALAAKSYGIRWNYLSDSAAQYRFGLDGGSTAGGTVNAEHYLSQNGNFTYDNGVNKGNTFSYSGVASGKRAPGWMTLDSGARHLALLVRDFWQQYPIELNVQGNTLTAALFAQRGLNGAAASTQLPSQAGTAYKRPNDFYFLRPGGAKTHQLRLAFGDSQPSSTAVGQLNDGYQRHRLELTASPSWYAQSGVFGDIDTGNAAASTGYSAMLLQDIYIPSIEKPNSDNLDPTDLGGDATMYGWRDWGDRLRAGWNNVVNGVRIPAFYNDTHIGANNFFHEFVRTGEQRWFQLGEISTRHFADIDVAHGPRKGYWDTAYPMGQQPAGEIHAEGHNNEDHQTRNMHWGHAHVSGLSDLYLLTGDKRSLEVLTEIANWWKFVTPHFFKTPFDKTVYREAERDYGWPLYVMNEYVRVTGDASYHKAVNAQLVNYLIQWWQTPMNHIGYNAVTKAVSVSSIVNVNDASQGTGYWTMYHMDNDSLGCNPTAPNICPDGTNPWMAGALLSAVIKFYEQDKLMAAAGKGAGIPSATIEDMLLQCMNYIVKYGYEPTVGFVYSEVQRDSTGGHTLLDYPLAYLDRLYKQRMAAGGLAHPQWYDTQPRWSTIAKGYYNEFLNMPVGANTQSYGFYGYEMVTPVDFFSIMRGQ